MVLPNVGLAVPLASLSLTNAAKCFGRASHSGFQQRCCAFCVEFLDCSSFRRSGTSASYRYMLWLAGEREWQSVFAALADMDRSCKQARAASLCNAH